MKHTNAFALPRDVIGPCRLHGKIPGYGPVDVVTIEQEVPFGSHVRRIVASDATTDELLIEDVILNRGCEGRWSLRTATERPEPFPGSMFRKGTQEMKGSTIELPPFDDVISVSGST